MEACLVNYHFSQRRPLGVGGREMAMILLLLVAGSVIAFEFTSFVLRAEVAHSGASLELKRRRCIPVPPFSALTTCKISRCFR